MKTTIRLVGLCLGWCLASIAVTGTPSLALELYVSPAGDDGNPGTRQRPLATLHRAGDLLPRFLIQCIIQIGVGAV